jgi:uncharacterized membrane protein
MADETTLILLVASALAIVLIYAYVTLIYKILKKVGFSGQEVGIIVFVTLFLGSITIPIFKDNGWWIGLSIGGAIIPLLLCASLLWSKRVNLAEFLIGIVIVSFISYFVTRPEQNVGIVADFPIAFAPAIAAGLFSLSAFWIDVSKAAPLAYSSGVIGTILGADIFHLSAMLSFPAPADTTAILSIGGANIFDMVYMTGIVAVAVDIIVFWIRKQEAKYGLASYIPRAQKSVGPAPASKEFKPAPTLRPGSKGRI